MHSIGGFSAGATAARGQGARESKVNRAYLALKQAIVTGTLAPDTPIDKSEWCARFEVSRLSLTGAINRRLKRFAVIGHPISMNWEFVRGEISCFCVVRPGRVVGLRPNRQLKTEES